MNENSADAALAVMDAHIVALNARDGTALAATLHFPHFRLSGAQLKTWQTPDSYLQDFLNRAGDEWHHSGFEDMQVLSAAPDKVHIDAEIRRFRSDDTLITRFRSLWVITLDDARWAAKFRSSFARQ